MTSVGSRCGVPAIVPATACVCAVELATLSSALRSDLSITSISILMACFHGGYLVADPIRQHFLVGSRALAFVTALAGASLCFIGTAWSVPLAAAALFIFNSVAQAVRRSFKDIVPVRSASKNAGKALGMALGGGIGAFHLGPLALGIFVVYFGTQSVKGRPTGPRLVACAPLSVRDRTLLWGEFFHHAHYFAYCYSFWYLAPSLISPWTGLWFVFGWVGYFVTERIWREGRRLFAPKAMAGGHLLVALALVAMPQVSTVGVLAAWFVTGIGGGTAYMLGNAGHRGPRERFEDGGHVAGVLVAGLVAMLAKDNPGAAELTVWFGACLAVITAIIFTSVSPRARDRDNQRVGEGSAHR